MPLGIDGVSINGDLETPAAGRDQREGPNVLFELQQFVRQTDGVRLVVSNTAILDGDFQTHGNDGHTIEANRGIVKRRSGVQNGQERPMEVRQSLTAGTNFNCQIQGGPGVQREMSAWFNTLNWCR